jgi:putative ABC transport system permease protein
MKIIISIIRKALKNKEITGVNILGLTAGFVCSIFLVSWVIQQSTFDNFVKDKGSIYRVNLKGIINNEPIKSSGCYPGLASEAVKLIPEITEAVRITINFQDSEDQIRTEGNQFFRVKGFAADEGFFSFFPFPVLEGQPDKALTTPDNIVITKDLAWKCFGNETAIGKSLFIRDKNYMTAVVLENIPANSHLQFDYIISTVSLGKSWIRDQWGSDNSNTYLKVDSHANIDSLNSKITSIVHNHIPQLANNFDVSFVLQPLKDIPFDNGFKWDFVKKTNKRNIYVLSVVALLIMFIACMNFTNLFISTAIKRNKEVGIKISNGASKFSIAKEHLEEVLLYVLFSFVISLVLVPVLHPYFNRLSGEIVEINYTNIRFLVMSISLITGTVILAGIFPGLYLTKINISEILRGTKNERSKSSLQKALVTAQFTIATILLLAMITVYKQVDFLHSKELGFDKDNILYLYTEGKLENFKEQKKMKEELLRSPYISKVAYRGALPTEWSNGSTVGKSKDDLSGNFEWIQVGRDYFDLSGIEFVEGDNAFSYMNDTARCCIINEKAAEVLGLEPPVVEKPLYMYSNNNKEFIIKGVTKNVNTKTLSQNIDPCIYTKPRWKSNTAILMFKLTGDYSKGIEAIKKYYTATFTEQPFEYHFLDETYDALYKSEEKARSIISWFTVIALILTSLGLFAMVHFITEQRTKEIGVRKVNGAKISEVMTMLNKDFIKWVIIAFVIATPVAYYAMNKWLENFAYKTELSWWIFALAGVLALGIALLTVSFQSWKAATKNPVESLRYE